VEAALFPGYLFCRLNPDKALPVLTTAGVYDIVRVGERVQPIDAAEIEAIRRLVASSCSAKPWPYLKSGDRVRVEFGSLAGVEGLLVSEKGVDRLILSISMLQRSVCVEIDRTWVQPVRQSWTSSNLCTSVYSTDAKKLSYEIVDTRRIRTVELSN
jgi:transcription antitermination factor NusG